MKNWATSVVALVVFSLAIILGSALASAQVQCTQGVCVTTWHNDIGRTGQNISEGTLTTTLVGNQAIFGRKCRRWHAGGTGPGRQRVEYQPPGGE